MIKLNRTSKASAMRVRLALTCALSVLAACSQGSSNSNTTGEAGAGMDNSLADAPPPASALPLATGPAPAYRPAPVASGLPPAPRAPLGQVPAADQYAYLNQAYAFSQSLADAPPDYTYDYQGEEPWVWQSPDGYYRVAERLPMGVRYFYYAPGASEPYLVQDPQYAYGYSDGRLAVMYGPDGKVLPYDVQARQAGAAGLYLAWAASLYAAARHEEHVAVSQARWEGERQAVYADQARWSAAQQRNTGWAAYSQTHQDDQAHWADQRYVRAAEAARFAQAVRDPTALAHAQHAATDARAAVVQSRGAPPPGSAQESAVSRHESGQGAPRAAGSSEVQREQAYQPPRQAADQAHEPVRTRDEARGPAPAAAEAQRFAARPAVAQREPEARAQQDAHAGPRPGPQLPPETRGVQTHQGQAHEAEVRPPHAAERQATPPAVAPRAAAERSPAETRRPPTEQAAAPAPPRPPRPAPAVETRPTPEPQAHAQVARPAPHPEAAPPRPRPDAPHP